MMQARAIVVDMEEGVINEMLKVARLFLEFSMLSIMTHCSVYLV